MMWSTICLSFSLSLSLWLSISFLALARARAYGSTSQTSDKEMVLREKGEEAAAGLSEEIVYQIAIPANRSHNGVHGGGEKFV
jgi:hypothetical protein